MAENIVLDASGMLRSNHDFRRGDYLIPECVLHEIKLEKDRDALDASVRAGYVRVADPVDASREAVISASKQTGDYPVLSPQDIDVLALAYERDAAIASDDYAIQNTAKKLGIKTLSTCVEGIKKEIIWSYVCGGCGKKADSTGVCGVCGHKILRRKS
ncbi:MAG: hypothetical protein KKD39_01950 [Candidatus Altiarchaeota archaeon]|nr:hypothetical protein [Candidatus Altiarchaeota archaeon]